MPPATSVRSIHLDSGGGMNGGRTGGYDQSLLAATPEVSKTAKQESYNIDLLEDHPSSGSPVDRNAASGITGPGVVNKEISYSSLPNHVRLNGVPEEERYYRHGGPRRPWHRRPVGIITLAILFIVIVGAIVGGAVGGTVGHHKANSSQQEQGVGAPTSGQGTQGTNGGQQGVGTQGTAPSASDVHLSGSSLSIVVLPTGSVQQSGGSQGVTTAGSGQLNIEGQQ